MDFDNISYVALPQKRNMSSTEYSGLPVGTPALHFEVQCSNLVSCFNSVRKQAVPNGSFRDFLSALIQMMGTLLKHAKTLPSWFFIPSSPTTEQIGLRLTIDGVWIGEWIYWPLVYTTRNYTLHITGTQTSVLSLLQSPLAVSWQRLLPREILQLPALRSSWHSRPCTTLVNWRRI
jgi:hypothetical protein